jgi:hypothetical protein
MHKYHLLDVVVLLEDLPEEGLQRGNVGTLVECLGEDAWEVEFVDEEGYTYGLLALRESQMVVLVKTPTAV